MDITFSAYDIASAGSAFNTSFKSTLADYANGLADSGDAGVSSDDVTITGFASGSLVVSATVYFLSGSGVASTFQVRL